uniref:hypothetical protein n=1 Tax=Sphingomonas sp. OTU376 TaxID=3043863 RepID=UPI00313CC0F3
MRRNLLGVQACVNDRALKPLSHGHSVRLLAAFGGRKHPAILIRVLLLLPEEKFGQRGCDGLIAGAGFCLRNAYAAVIKIDLIVSHAKDFAMPHGCVEAKSDEQV